MFTAIQTVCGIVAELMTAQIISSWGSKTSDWKHWSLKSMFKEGIPRTETNQNAIEKESFEGRPRARRCWEYNTGMRSGRVIC